MTIGLIDWGIGGLSVYRKLKSNLPKIDIIYLSDAGAVPYGKMSAAKLVLRLNKACEFFRQRGVFDIVIACNAASTVLEQLRLANRDLNLSGMLDSGAKLIRSSKLRRCLILGGKRTIESKYFQNEFLKSRITIEAKVAQPWSAFIEKGDISSLALKQSLRKVLSNLKFSPSVVLLACTHYPAIASQVQALLPNALLLDPASEIVNQLAREFHFDSQRSAAANSARRGSVIFYTTGSISAMRSGAKKAFGVKIGVVQKIIL